MLQNLSAKNSERVRKPLIWLQTLVLVLYCIEAGMLYSSTRDSNVSIPHSLWASAQLVTHLPFPLIAMLGLRALGSAQLDDLDRLAL